MALLRAALSRRLVFAGAALALLTTGPAAAQTKRASVTDVQAVFLFNFAQFVDWPPEAFSDPQAPLVIGILGQDPFGSFLDETVRGESVRGRPFEIRRYRRLEEVKDCHVLFIAGPRRIGCRRSLPRSRTVRFSPSATAMTLPGRAGSFDSYSTRARSA